MMKKLFFSFSLLMTALSAQAATDITTVKVADGSTAYCKNKSDVQRNKFGVYTSKVKSITEVGSTVKAEIQLNFSRCTEEQGTFKFEREFPANDYSYQTIKINGTQSTIDVKVHEVRLLSFVDGRYKVFSNVVLENEHSQLTEIKFDIKDVLSENQLSQLDEGKKVIAAFDYILQKKVSILNGKEVLENKTVSFGAMRARFSLQKNLSDNQLTVRILK